MNYEYDVFISYRRDQPTTSWINKHFIPILETHIFNELGRHPVFYIDSQLEAGTTWPIALGHALGKSKTIIPLWTKTYRNSIWCSCEISHMLERETKTGYRTIETPFGLIFPTIIHDGETMPINISSIQKIEIQECFNTRMSTDSPLAELLYEKLRPLGRQIAIVLDNAPEWQKEWQIESSNTLYKEFYLEARAQQMSIPKFSSL